MAGRLQRVFTINQKTRCGGYARSVEEVGERVYISERVAQIAGVVASEMVAKL